VVDTELLLYIRKLIVQCGFHLVVEIGNDNVRLSDRVLLCELSNALGEELEPLPSLVVDQSESCIKDRTKASLSCCLEQWKLEAIGVVCVVKADDLGKPLPHLETVGKCPDKTNEAVRLIIRPLNDIGNIFLIKQLDQCCSRSVPVQFVSIDESPGVVDVPLREG
jgi:hypothetical protein